MPPLWRSMSLAACGRDLHQPARAGARGAVVELRLRVDHGGDQRRVDVLFLGLLADDVLVAQRQRQLLDHVVELAEKSERQARRDAGRDRRAPGEQTPPPRLLPHARSFSTRADSSRSRSSTLPSFSHHVRRARRLLRLGQLARLALVDQRVAARLGALARGPRPRRPPRRVVSKTPSMPASKSSGTSTTATSASSGSDVSQAPIRSPTRGWIWPLEPLQLVGIGEDDRADPIAVDLARRARPSAPQRSTRRESSGSVSSSSWTTASLEIVSAPSRSNAASASDFPAAIPPVSPIVSGRATGELRTRRTPRTRHRPQKPQPQARRLLGSGASGSSATGSSASLGQGDLGSAGLLNLGNGLSGAPPQAPLQRVAWRWAPRPQLARTRSPPPRQDPLAEAPRALAL